MGDDARFVSLMEPIARHFLGDPNQRLSSKTELRYGTRGSLSIDIEKGVWHDHETGEGGGPLAFVTRETKLEGRARFDWLREHGFDVDDVTNGKGRARIVETYDYTDEEIRLLFQVVRYDPKDFRQRKPNGADWSWSVKGVRQVPYRLPELSEAIASGRPVFIVEGEKDVDNLHAIGVPATTNAGGAGKWRAELNDFFRDADVIIIPDNDPQKKHPKTGELMFHEDGRPILPGQDHARSIAAALDGIAARIRVLDLATFWPDMPPKGDVSDWLAAGGDIEGLYALAEQLPDWATSPTFEATKAPPTQAESDPGGPTAPPAEARVPWTVPPLAWRDPASIPRRVFLYGYYYARGFVSATIADGGIGKSILKIVEFLACASGLPLLGITPTERVRVLYWNGDDPYVEVERRIHAVAQHYNIDLKKLIDERWLFVGTRKEQPFYIATMNGRLATINQDTANDICAFIKDNDIGLACFDPLRSVHRVPENSNDDMDIIGDAFNNIAERTNAAIGLDHHIRKMAFGQSEVTAATVGVLPWLMVQPDQ